MSPLLLLAGFFLVTATSLPTSAQPSQQRPAAARPQSPACELAAAPEACSSCSSLMAAVASLPSERLSSGPVVEGVWWTPIFVAQRLHCLDAGVALLRRGADPNIGGRAGALAVEVAMTAAGEPGPAAVVRRQRAMDWLHRLGRHAFDLDARLPTGSSARTVWNGAPSPDPAARAIWSYAVGLSVAQPVLAEGATPGNPDRPSPETGVTRPSETAVARGVEVYMATQRASGMSGVVARIQRCWEERRPPGLTREQFRWSLEACAAMDVAAALFQEDFNRMMRSDTTPPYLRSFEQDQRLLVFRQLAAEGLVPAAHRRALFRSVSGWLDIHALAEPPRVVAPVVPGGRAPGGGGVSSPASPGDASHPPAYPDAARRAGEVGEVGLTVRVAEDGRVAVVDIDRSSGFGALDDAARSAALRWRFRAASRDGVEVPSFVRLTASFVLPPGAPPRASMRVQPGS